MSTLPINAEAFDTAVDELEEKVLVQLSDSLACEYRTPMLLKALSTLNAVKRRSASPDEIGSTKETTTTIVNINLPAHLVSSCTLEHKKNAQNQVIEVEGREMVTMPSNKIRSMLPSATSNDGDILNIEIGPSTGRIGVLD